MTNDEMKEKQEQLMGLIDAEMNKCRINKKRKDDEMKRSQLENEAERRRVQEEKKITRN